MPFQGIHRLYELFLAAISYSPAPLTTTFFVSKSTQVIDYRIIPAVSAVFIIVGIYWLIKNRGKNALISVCFGIGMLSYTYLELVTTQLTGDLIIGSLGHELAEFWFLLIVGEFLKRAFPVLVQQTVFVRTESASS